MEDGFFLLFNCKSRYHPNKTEHQLKFIINEWEKIIPYIENEMSVSDIDKLITGLEFYFEMNHTMFPEITEEEESDSKYCDQFCPLHFAVHEDDFWIWRTHASYSIWLQYTSVQAIKMWWWKHANETTSQLQRWRTRWKARYIDGIITLITMLARMS